jgi:tetratricopeptide (TPR) repeat protein
MKQYLLTFILFLGFTFPIVAFGEKPDFSDKPEDTIKAAVAQIAPPSSEPVLLSQVVDTSEDEAEEEFDEEAEELKYFLYDQRLTLRKKLELKQFPVALEIFGTISENILTKEEKLTKQDLLFFDSIEAKESEYNTMFAQEDTLDDQTKITIQKLYREAQHGFLSKNKPLSKDLLIQILFLDRRNFKAKALLEEGLDLEVGAYKVENMESKYWQQSSVHFYGGNYEKAVKDLEILSYFSGDDPTVFERLGSSYYMMGQKEKAISAWTTAQFLNPTNKDLDEIIQKTRILLVQDKVEEEERLRKKEKRSMAKSEEDPVEMKLMGVFPKQEQAYNFAQEVRKEGLQAIVEELESGKWAVKMPKEQIPETE